MLINTLGPWSHPDTYPFQFLTLALSLQASYAAPLILLAQNRQADRDRKTPGQRKPPHDLSPRSGVRCVGPAGGINPGKRERFRG